MAGRTKKTILLIDDDTSLLITLSDFLRFEGYDVVTADRGEDGLRKLEQTRPDLIILDMSMPGMGGVGFLKAISPRGRTEYPVLVLTARAQLAESFGNVDVDGFIVKPCDPNDLLMEVNRIVFSAGHAVPTEGRPDGAVGGKILLGEDDAREAERLRADLARQGYAVEAVRTGPELLERAIQHQPDVVVMNVVLGKMNGEAVAGILREMPKTGAIPVILYHTSSISIPEDRYGKASNIRKVIASDKTVDLQSGIREVLSRGGGSRR